MGAYDVSPLLTGANIFAKAYNDAMIMKKLEMEKAAAVKVEHERMMLILEKKQDYALEVEALKQAFKLEEKELDIKNEMDLIQRKDTSARMLQNLTGGGGGFKSPFGVGSDLR